MVLLMLLRASNSFLGCSPVLPSKAAPRGPGEGSPAPFLPSGSTALSFLLPATSQGPLAGGPDAGVPPP